MEQSGSDHPTRAEVERPGGGPHPADLPVQRRDRAAAGPGETLHRYEQMLDSLGDAFVTLDRDLVVTGTNPGVGAVTGVPGPQMVGRPITDVPALAAGAFATACGRALRGRRPVMFRHRHRIRGSWLDVRATPSATGLSLQLVDTGDEPAAPDFQVREAQQRAVAELGQHALEGAGLDQLLAESVQSVETVFQTGRVAVMGLMRGGETLQLLAGLSPEQDANDETLLMSRTDLAGSALYETVVTGVAARVPSPRTPDRLGPGGLPPATDSVGIRSDLAVPLFDENGLWGLLAAASDREDTFSDHDLLYLRQLGHVLSSAIQRRQTEDRLRHQADHDVLTDLPNRSLLRRELEAALAGDGGVARVGLLLLDLDGFKDVNDALGHEAGDVVLTRLARRLCTAADANQVVARLGGDEFAVCIRTPVSTDLLRAAAERLREVVGQPFELAGIEVSLSVSIGIALAPGHGTDAATLMRHADVAMYRAKSGRGAATLYDAAVDGDSQDRLGMIADLRRAIRDDELVLHFQPVVDLATGIPVGTEALVRWQHPRRGLLAPQLFIGLAEQTHLIHALTEWTVKRAAVQSAAWREAALPGRVAVNIAAPALTERRSTATLVADLIDRRELLSIEVTESSMIDDNARAALEVLNEGGVECALDDFGTGWSSLAHLRRLPVSTLKIDRSFVQPSTGGGPDRAIIRSVVDLAAALKLHVVAEGVEDLGVVRLLQGTGVGYAQGFWYARPMPSGEATAWLREHTATPD